jgi:hypothetical protein
MHTGKRVRVVWFGAAALALAAAAGGCNDIFSSKSCTADGRLYEPGMSVPGGSCTSCNCGDDGQVHCLALPCVAATDCVFDAAYTYGSDGDLVAYRDTVTLAPPATFSLQRVSTFVEPADAQCLPPLPGCHDPTRIDASDIITDLRQPDVMAALALSAPPFYGHDARPVDGVAFKLQRADGHGLLVGDPCQADASCVTPPPGVQKLVDDLRVLTAQQLKDPTCAALPGSAP